MIKNMKEDEGKCKTVIQIDGAIVFTSDVYTWKQPVDSDYVTETEFEVSTGYWNREPEGAIRNISIKAYQ